MCEEVDPNAFTLYSRIDLPQAQSVESTAAANLKLNPALGEAGSTQSFAGSTLRSQKLRPRVWAPAKPHHDSQRSFSFYLLASFLSMPSQGVCVCVCAVFFA